MRLKARWRRGDARRQETQMGRVSEMFAIPIAALAAFPLTGCGAVDVDTQARAYQRQQASGFIGLYEQARARGDTFTMCVKSNQVSAAYRDAKDPADAEAWAAKNAEDCGAALGSATATAR